MASLQKSVSHPGSLANFPLHGLHGSVGAPSVGDDEGEPVVGADDDVIAQVAVPHIAWHRIPLHLPTAVTPAVDVNVTKGALRAPAHAQSLSASSNTSWVSQLTVHMHGLVRIIAHARLARPHGKQTVMHDSCMGMT